MFHRSFFLCLLFFIFFFLDKNNAQNYKQLIINEIFCDPDGDAQPDPRVLPAIEYVELYNPSNQMINLNGLFLSGGKIGNGKINPQSYVILCPAASVGLFASFGNVIGVSSWNTLTNTGEKIILTSSTGQLIDSVTYTLAFYNDPLKKDGGWSLEQVNPLLWCKMGSSNWKSSVHPSGGTPGKQNSVYDVTSDTQPPLVERMELLSSTHLRIFFNEEMDTLSLYKGVYEWSGLKLVPHHITMKSVDFLMMSKLDSGKVYSCRVSQVKDCSGNMIFPVENKLGIGGMPLHHELVITEIFADPSPLVGLPEAEYMELYNSSDRILDLAYVKIVDGKTMLSFPSYLLFPKEYVIVTAASNVAKFQSYGKVVGVLGYFSLLNQGELLQLVNATHQEVYSVAYTVDWYRDAEKQDGGWSLEMIDVRYPCVGQMNWKASENKLGGTPGVVNSVSSDQPDLTGPVLEYIQPIDSLHVKLIFNELLDKNVITYAEFALSPYIAIDSVVLDKDQRSIILFFQYPIQPKIRYKVRTSLIQDCSGNTMLTGQEFFFSLPDKIDSTDIVINEVLFNPKPGGVDFVELYNRSNKYFNLKKCKIGSYRDNQHLEVVFLVDGDVMLEPYSYLVLTSDKMVLKQFYPSSVDNVVIERKNLPSYDDDQGVVLIFDSLDHIIDQMAYRDDFHFALLKDKEGVSLEKISPELSSNQKESWHSAGSEVGYATPGYRNSQYHDVLSSEHELTVEPRVFTPDNDGYQDVAIIHYRFSQPGYIGTVSVFDVEGRKVKDLVVNALLSSEGSWVWDGLDAAGESVLSGYYVLMGTFFRLDGDVSRWKSVVVVGQVSRD